MKLIDECEKNPALRKDVIDYCAEDILFWVNVFCWTKDPRKDPSDIPFVTYEEYQDEALLDLVSAIDTGHDLLLDKSRDMGASWMVLYVFQWFWLFKQGSDFKIGSRKEDYVDINGDMDTLFEKLRYNLRRQPPFMYPKGFQWRKHSSYMKLVNPLFGNSIIGESANANFGTGGRRKAVLLDEFAKWDHDEKAWTSTADVTKCRIPTSTPYGAGTKHAELAKGTKGKIRKIELHWTLHPEKNKGAYYLDLKTHEKIPIDLKKDKKAAYRLWKKWRGKKIDGIRGGVVRSIWYDNECGLNDDGIVRRNDREIAQELDINHLESGNPFFDLTALQKQKVWDEIQLKAPNDEIPYGKHIRARMIELDHKINLIPDRNGAYRIFERPRQGYQYVIGGDVSEGLPKGDECFGTVREKTTRNVVATINGLYKPDEFDLILHHLWLYYEKQTDEAIVACENNNHGYTTNVGLRELGSRCYFHDPERYKERKKAVKASQAGQVAKKRGWVTNKVTRPLMLDQMDQDIRAGVELRCEIILKQCETFVRPENKPLHPEADGTYLDDGVIATAIAGQVIVELPYKPKARARVKSAKLNENIKNKRNAGICFVRRR